MNNIITYINNNLLRRWVWTTNHKRIGLLYIFIKKLLKFLYLIFIFFLFCLFFITIENWLIVVFIKKNVPLLDDFFFYIALTSSIFIIAIIHIPLILFYCIKQYIKKHKINVWLLLLRIIISFLLFIIALLLYYNNIYLFVFYLVMQIKIFFLYRNSTDIHIQFMRKCIRSVWIMLIIRVVRISIIIILTSYGYTLPLLIDWCITIINNIVKHYLNFISNIVQIQKNYQIENLAFLQIETIQEKKMTEQIITTSDFIYCTVSNKITSTSSGIAKNMSNSTNNWHCTYFHNLKTPELCRVRGVWFVPGEKMENSVVVSDDDEFIANKHTSNKLYDFMDPEKPMTYIAMRMAMRENQFKQTRMFGAENVLLLNREHANICNNTLQGPGHYMISNKINNNTLYSISTCNMHNIIENFLKNKNKDFNYTDVTGNNRESGIITDINGTALLFFDSEKHANSFMQTNKYKNNIEKYRVLFPRNKCIKLETEKELLLQSQKHKLLAEQSKIIVPKTYDNNNNILLKQLYDNFNLTVSPYIYNTVAEDIVDVEKNSIITYIEKKQTKYLTEEIWAVHNDRLTILNNTNNLKTNNICRQRSVDREVFELESLFHYSGFEYLSKLMHVRNNYIEFQYKKKYE